MVRQLDFHNLTIDPWTDLINLMSTVVQDFLDRDILQRKPSSRKHDRGETMYTLPDIPQLKYSYILQLVLAIDRISYKSDF